MNTRIIYPLDPVGIAIMTPDATSGITAEEIARRDVPSGVPYLIVDLADLPTDWSETDKWTTDFTEPDGYGVGVDAWLAEQGVAP